jgi:hypothetical protein
MSVENPPKPGEPNPKGPGRKVLDFALLTANGINYVCLIPYYLHNYYLKTHQPPSVKGLVLVVATALWFAAGYTLRYRYRRMGTALLISFLVVECVFYGFLVASGAAKYQLSVHDPVNWTIFLVGYISASTSFLYLIAFARRSAASGRPK